MYKRIFRFQLIVLICIACAACLLSQTASSDAEWPCFRRDLFNTGISNLKGPVTTLEERWRFSLGGTPGLTRMADIDSDGFDEIVAINAGKIVAFQQDGTLMWTSDVIGVNTIFGIVDIDNDDQVDIICARTEPPTVFIMDGETGEVQWQHFFPPPAGTIYSGGVKIADLNNSGDGKLELFCWPWSGDKYGYAFSFKNGVANGSLLWQVSDEITWPFPPQVMVADMNNDSIPEVVIGTYGHIYGWQGDNGKPLIDFGFTTGNGKGRNYGIIKLTNIDDDPYPEIAIMAHSLNEHLTMIDNLGPNGDNIPLALLWDKWFEYSYPEDNKDVRVSPNSVGDLDNDGEVELVCALFNNTGDNQWHLMIYDAQSGATEYDLVGYYLYDVRDLDNDNSPEICISREPSRVPLRNNLSFLKGNNNSYSIEYTKASARVVIELEPILPGDVNSNAGNDVLFVRDLEFDGIPNIFTTDSKRFYAYAFESNNLVRIWYSYPTDYASVLLDVGRTSADSFLTSFISSIDGHSFLIDAIGNVVADIPIGSYYAMPVAADLDSDGSIEVLVQSALGFMNVLDVQHATLRSAPKIKWQQAGNGKSAKYGRNSTAYVDDFNSDGKKEVVIAFGNNLLIIDDEGHITQEYNFNSYPYEWVTGYFNEDSVKDILVAFNTGSMHTNNIHVYDGTGGKTPLWTKDYGPYSGYVAVYDFTEDGIDDIILCEHGDLITLDGKNGRRWGFCPGVYYHTPVLMDVDFNDSYEVINSGGYLEVSANKMHNNGRSITQIWEQATGYLDCYARMPGTADVDNDQHVEIGVSSTNGIFTCYDAANGNTEWTYNLGTTASDIICMDADNDDRLEFIFGGMNGYLYILNGEADATNRIEAQFKLEAPVGSPIVADLNADGIAEILVTTYDGILHCFSSTATLVSQADSCMPFAFRLAQNYPNPFNSQTQIRFCLPEKEFVSLKIFNLNGQLVRRLVNREYAPGYHQVNWDGKDQQNTTVASSIYIYSLHAGKHCAEKKLLFIQ